MTRRGGRELTRAVIRRIFVLYTADIFARRIDQEPPLFAADASLVLHRMTCREDLVGAVPGMLAGRFADIPLRVKLLNPLRRARWRKEISNRFQRGDVAYVATVRDDLAAWVWLSRASFRDPTSGLHIRLAPGERYTFDLWAVPNYRKLGSGGFVLSGLLRDLHNESSELPQPDDESIEPRVYGYIDRSNLPSLFLTKIVFGFTPVQTVKHVRLLSSLGWQVPFTDKPRAGPCSRKRQPQPTSSR